MPKAAKHSYGEANQGHRILSWLLTPDESPQISGAEKMKNISEVINQVMDNGLDKNPRIMALLNCVIRNPYDEEKVRLLNRLVAPVIAKKQMFGTPYKEPDEKVTGKVVIACTEQGIPAGFNLDEPHCLIVGQTGCGKTVLMLMLIGQLL